MKAGIDFGSSLVKAAWIRDGQFRFASTANVKLEELTRQLSDEGIKQINLAGIGYSNAHSNYFREFELRKAKGDAIKLEKKLQVEGIQKLMRDQGENITNFILVSIGTGTSYALRLYGFAIPVPLGNSLGGGFLGGIGRHLGINDYGDMSRIASEGTPLNVYVKDKLPDLNGTVIGEYVVAHLSKAENDSKREDVLATAVDIVSVTTIKDLALLSHSSRLFKWTKDIVYIGSTVSGFPSLRKSLEKYSSGMLSKRTHFPHNGEFSLAIGAYYMQE